VLDAVEVEIKTFQAIWAPYNPDSTVIFLRVIGSKVCPLGHRSGQRGRKLLTEQRVQVRHDYENCACPATIEEQVTIPLRASLRLSLSARRANCWCHGAAAAQDVVVAIDRLQQFENKMLQQLQCRDASLRKLPASAVILAHADARHGEHAASPYSKLLWSWLDDQGVQINKTVAAFVDHEAWEPTAEGAQTSYSVGELFTQVFAYSADKFLTFGVRRWLPAAPGKCARPEAVNFVAEAPPHRSTGCLGGHVHVPRREHRPGLHPLRERRAARVPPALPAGVSTVMAARRQACSSPAATWRGWCRSCRRWRRCAVCRQASRRRPGNFDTRARCAPSPVSFPSVRCGQVWR
jgi:hypothetical protein